MAVVLVVSGVIFAVLQRDATAPVTSVLEPTTTTAIGTAGELRTAAYGAVTVWRDSGALDEALTLRRAGTQDPRAYRGLAACTVKSGTKAVVVNADGIGVRTVRIVDGPHVGCRGAIEKELFAAP